MVCLFMMIYLSDVTYHLIYVYLIIVSLVIHERLQHFFTDRFGTPLVTALAQRVVFAG